MAKASVSEHVSALRKLRKILRDEISGTETTVRHETEMPDPARYAEGAEVHSAVVAVQHFYGVELPDELPHTARASWHAVLRWVRLKNQPQDVVDRFVTAAERLSRWVEEEIKRLSGGAVAQQQGTVGERGRKRRKKLKHDPILVKRVMGAWKSRRFTKKKDLAAELGVPPHTVRKIIDLDRK